MGGMSQVASIYEVQRLGEQRLVTAEEVEVDLRQSDIRATVAKKMLSCCQSSLPELTALPSELRARANLINSPAILMQDPANIAIVSVVIDLGTQKQRQYADDFKKQQQEPQPSLWKRALVSIVDKLFFDAEVIPDETWPVSISEVLEHFPAVEHDTTVARLQVLEAAGLLTYFYRGQLSSHASPRLWKREDQSATTGFKISAELSKFLVGS